MISQYRKDRLPYNLWYSAHRILLIDRSAPGVTFESQHPVSSPSDDRK